MTQNRMHRIVLTDGQHKYTPAIASTKVNKLQEVVTVKCRFYEQIGNVLMMVGDRRRRFSKEPVTIIFRLPNIRIPALVIDQHVLDSFRVADNAYDGLKTLCLEFKIPNRAPLKKLASLRLIALLGYQGWVYDSESRSSFHLSIFLVEEMKYSSDL